MSNLEVVQEEEDKNQLHRFKTNRHKISDNSIMSKESGAPFLKDYKQK
jgi:hypothetical protein